MYSLGLALKPLFYSILFSVASLVMSHRNPTEASEVLENVSQDWRGLDPWITQWITQEPTQLLHWINMWVSHKLCVRPLRIWGCFKSYLTLLIPFWLCKLRHSLGCLSLGFPTCTVRINETCLFVLWNLSMWSPWCSPRSLISAWHIIAIFIWFLASHLW